MCIKSVLNYLGANQGSSKGRVGGATALGKKQKALKSSVKRCKIKYLKVYSKIKKIGFKIKNERAPKS